MSLFCSIDAVCVLQALRRPRHLARLASPLCCPHCRYALHRALSLSRQARLTAARQLQVVPRTPNMHCCLKGMRQRKHNECFHAGSPELLARVQLPLCSLCIADEVVSHACSPLIWRLHQQGLHAGGLEQRRSSGEQVTAASVSEGRRLLGAGSPGGQGRRQIAATWGILRSLRRLLQAQPDQAAPGSLPHLQHGSALAGNNLSEGDEDVASPPAAASQGQGQNPLRAQGVQDRPLVALRALSFLDMGAPTNAVHPAAAPSNGDALTLLHAAPTLVPKLPCHYL